MLYKQTGCNLMVLHISETCCSLHIVGESRLIIFAFNTNLCRISTYFCRITIFRRYACRTRDTAVRVSVSVLLCFCI